MRYMIRITLVVIALIGAQTLQGRTISPPQTFATPSGS